MQTSGSPAVEVEERSTIRKIGTTSLGTERKVSMAEGRRTASYAEEIYAFLRKHRIALASHTVSNVI